MNAIKILALAILVPFSLLSAYAVAQVGYLGIIAYHLPSPAGWQVITDLVIAVLLICLWMIQDARRTGRSAWPYVVASLFLGSFGVLFYLLLTPARSGETVGQPA
jgi:Protein of unknown function DUF2834